MNVVIGIDPHKASHTAVAIDEAEDELSSVKVRRHSAPGRRTDRLGRAFREAHLGHRVRRRVGLSAGPAARGPRRDCGRCAGHFGLSHPGAGHGALQQERPQRCPLDRDRRAAGTEAAHRRTGRPLRGAAGSWPSATSTSATSGPGWSAGSTPSSPSSHRAELPRKCTCLTLRCSWPRSAPRPRPSRSASTWPSSSSTTCAGSTAQTQGVTSSDPAGRPRPLAPR